MQRKVIPIAFPAIRATVTLALAFSVGAAVAGASPERLEAMANDMAGDAFHTSDDKETTGRVQSALDQIKEGTLNTARNKTRASAQGLRAYSVTATGPNRIAVADRKIVNAIFDQTLLEVQTDEITGQIFVFPKTKNPVALFLTTDRNETHSLTLVPDARMSQEIILGTVTAKEPEPYRRATSSLSVERASDIDTALKNLILALARNELPAGMSATNRCGENCLLRFTGETFEGEVISFKNKTASPMTLTEKLFYEARVLAVAIDKAELSAGDTTRIYRVKKIERALHPSS